MTPKLNLPVEAAKYISLQRLETQALGGRIHYNWLGKIAYGVYERVPFAKTAFRYYSSNIEPLLRSEAIISDYSAIMAREFETIRDYLERPLDTIVSIGPGIAGLEILISRYCRDHYGSVPYIVLIDKTGIDPVKYGFHEVAAVYNSLGLARQNLIDNGHPAERVEAVDADTAARLAKSHAGKVDLVTSLIAWGFHFPVGTYLELVSRILTPSGRLILDVRKGTDGKEKLATVFQKIDVIHDDPKFERVCAQRLS